MLHQLPWRVQQVAPEVLVAVNKASQDGDSNQRTFWVQFVGFKKDEKARRAIKNQVETYGGALSKLAIETAFELLSIGP
jgi:hypothetical protein